MRYLDSSYHTTYSDDGVGVNFSPLKIEERSNVTFLRVIERSEVIVGLVFFLKTIGLFGRVGVKFYSNFQNAPNVPSCMSDYSVESKGPKNI